MFHVFHFVIHKPARGYFAYFLVQFRGFGPIFFVAFALNAAVGSAPRSRLCLVTANLHG